MLIDFIPERPLDDLIQQARDDVSSWETYLDLCGGSVSSDLAESQELRMRQNPEVTLKFLRDENPLQRLAALHLVYNYWIDHPHFVSTCLDLAFHDPVKEVRGLAFLCLPRLRDFINDSRGQLRRLLKAVRPGDNVMSEIYQRERADFRKLLDEKNLQDWRDNAGELLDDMLTSAEKTDAYFHHENERVRYVALSLFTYHWRPSPNAVACALQISKDSSSSTRLKCAAIRLLGHCFQQSNDCKAGSLLASIVANESEDTLVRRGAYEQLYWVRGIPPLGQPERSALSAFPANVDWSFVRSFLPIQSDDGGASGSSR
jgi:hypothetical protein